MSRWSRGQAEMLVVITKLSLRATFVACLSLNRSPVAKLRAVYGHHFYSSINHVLPYTDRFLLRRKHLRCRIDLFRKQECRRQRPSRLAAVSQRRAHPRRGTSHVVLFDRSSLSGGLSSLKDPSEATSSGLAAHIDLQPELGPSTQPQGARTEAVTRRLTELRHDLDRYFEANPKRYLEPSRDARTGTSSTFE